jgi:hypothetical protein
MPLLIAVWLWPLMEIMQRYSFLKSLRSGKNPDCIFEFVP